MQNPSPAKEVFLELAVMTYENCSGLGEAPAVPLPGSALDDLMPVVYSELRRMASAYLRRERQNHTLQPTALAHEAYLRLAGQQSIHTADRGQLLGLAAEMMRRILINYAEARNASKRGPSLQVSLEEAEGDVARCREQDVDILALNEALTGLAAVDPQKSRIVELRFFGGLTMTEIATVIGKSLATVEREWSLARAWLYRELNGQGFRG